MSEPCPNCGRSKATNSEGWLLSPRTLCFRDVEGLFAMFTSSDCVVVERARLRARVSELEEQLAGERRLFNDECSAHQATVLKSAEPAREGAWVADSERSPPDGRRVLGLYQSFGGPRIVIAFREETDSDGSGDPLWTADGGAQYEHRIITHWMPLPAPPDAGKETT